MRVADGQLTLFLFSSFLCLSGGAILRPYRRRLMSRARLHPDAIKEAAHHSARERLPASNFQPTPRRCCQIGERVAKKKQICDIAMLAVVRKYNYERFKRGRLSKLSEKVSKCSAVYPKYFEKCCTYKEAFYKLLRKCQRKPRKQRQRCKQIIRKRYS